MNLIRTLLGRRQFLIAFISSSLTLAFGRIAKAFDLLFQTGVADASAKPEISEKKLLRGIVVYYSASGNTAQVANALWQGMKSVIACDVVPMKKVKPADMAKYDVMAIGSPNWYMREPANVKIFTHDMPRMDGKYCILFGTHGSMPFAQFWSMSRNILKKGMTIIGWNDWYGSDMIHGSQPDAEWGHPDEIDLAEAEAFGRQMGENAIRIYAGERDLIPRIPTPGKGEGNMWSPRVNDLGNITFAGPPPNAIPEFDFTKCVYPRCTRCIENCPVNAIDFSMITPAGSLAPDPITAFPLVLKEACQHCGGLCGRVCLYDAITYEGETHKKTINMTKCTYPKCTECLDHCPQDVIDFSVNPPVFHNWCESGDSICFDVCPENAIEYLTTAETNWWTRGITRGGAQEETSTTEEIREVDEAAYWASHYPPGFRPLIREEDIGSKGPITSFTTYPRLLINKELWPYHIDEE
ncbi:flavodoxin domain-containing protein [Deltaproteobacteria bacterium]|nr:flavodoxin domain-containing protein [Deltaproteobacteria bacterium]